MNLNPVAGVKALTRLVFGRYAYRTWRLPGSRIDWSTVGDGTGSSTVMAPLLWICRTFPEAPAALFREVENGQEEHVRGHDLLRLLARPNNFYTGPILWMATMADWNIDGNAYWLKLRDKTGRVRELWWAPHWMLEPRGTEDVFITHYEYRVTGAMALPVKIDPADVVHFRFGLDSDDPRKGYSPLKSVMREVFTDDEAATFTASLLKNMGVPGLIVSPTEPVSDEVAKSTKEYMLQGFTGDRRGEPMVMRGPTRVEQFGFNPGELLLRDLRRIPEERVSAVLGVPAIVAGLGAGLERSTFTNMGEARAMAYESNIIPSQRIIGEDVRFQLLSDFEADPWSMRFGFDLSKVRVLQGDEEKKAASYGQQYRDGIVMRSEARRAIGHDVAPADDVFAIPLHMALISRNDIAAVPAAAPTAGTPSADDPGVAPAVPKANGNGGSLASEVAAHVIRELQRTGAANGS